VARSRRGFLATCPAEMSQENLEVVRAGIEAFNAREVDRFAALVTEDFVWAPALPGAVGGGDYGGRAGIERYFRESGETWECLALECGQLRELKGDAVLMLGRAVGRGVGSGARVDMPFAFLAEFRAGRIARVATYLDHDEAVAASEREG